MKVKELIEELSKLDPEWLVVVARDPEGNGYRPLNCIDDNAAFIADDEQIALRVLDDAHRARGFTEEDLEPGAEPCVVLFP